MLNPTLSDLVGGIESVTLSDDEARRRGTQKTVLERRAPPTFDVLIEIQTRDRLVVHEDVSAAVDGILRGIPMPVEVRSRNRIRRDQCRDRRSRKSARLPSSSAPITAGPRSAPAQRHGNGNSRQEVIHAGRHDQRRQRQHGECASMLTAWPVTACSRRRAVCMSRSADR